MKLREDFEGVAARHLSEDELDDMLMGLGSAAAHAHLARCAACRTQVQEFHSIVTAFNEASLEWSEAKSNTISRDLTARHPRFLLTPAMTWSLVATLLLAVTAGAFELRAVHEQTLSARNAPAVVGPVVETAAAAANAPGTQVSGQDSQIAEDDAMLRAIDSEANRAEPSPLGEYRAVSLRRSTSERGQTAPVME
jgi:hypothetical protein